MNLARSKSQIKNRVDAYLWRTRSQPLLELRKRLDEEFSSLGQVAVIGGLIRDLAQVGASGFKSDIDLVIDEDPCKVRDFARSVDAVQNTFGGFRYSTGSWNIDFWSLKNTWAGVQGHVHVRAMDDLLKCTFFTSDALLYIVDTKSLVSRDEYLADLLGSRLEINLLPNPSPRGNLLRAVRRLLSRRMRMGPKLNSFVETHLNPATFSYLVDTETRLYGYSYAREYGDPDCLYDALVNPSCRYNESEMQYSLPL